MTDKKIPVPTPPSGTQPPRPVTPPPAPPTQQNLKMPNPTAPAKPMSSPAAPGVPSAKPAAATPVAPSSQPAPAKVSPGELPPPNLPPPSPGILKAPTASAVPAPNTPKPATPPMAPPGMAKPPGGPVMPPAPAAAQPSKPPQTPPASAPTQAQPVPQAQPSAQKAQYRPSPLRFLPFAAIALLVLGLGYFIFNRFFGAQTTTTTTGTKTTTTSSSKQVTITYWGLWENSRTLQDVLAEFEQQHPNIKVNYQAQSPRDYRERLQTAIASKKGPDVFRFHASWTPMLKAELTAVPTSVYSSADFQNTFYPIVEQQLKVENNYVGVPLMYEGLALLYNKDILRAANSEPPKTWAELKTLSNQLTIRGNGKIQRAGLAVGNATNVEHFSDILALLIYQSGGSPSQPTSRQVQEAVTYYTSFVKEKATAVWDEDLPNSSVAFARGEVAMIFAPSWRVHEIRNLNPNLSFGVAPVPQLGSNKVTWGSYWAEGVNAQSKYKTESWELIKFLSSKEGMLKFHSTASKERTFGELYSRTDLASQLAGNEYAAAYLSDAPYAQGWYMSSSTHDNGINDQIIKYYQDAVTSILNGKSETDSLSTVDKGVKQVLRQFNVSTEK